MIKEDGNNVRDASVLLLKECVHDQNDCSLRCLIQTSSDIYPINP